ncbi:Glucose/Sorbosone dehydrogenase [Candidatus Methylopumilus universalis]
MKKKSLIYLFFALMVTVLIVVAINAAIKRKICPYLLLKNYQQVATNPPALLNTQDLSGNFGSSQNLDFGSIVNLSNVKLTKSIILNGFKFQRGKVNVKDLGKTGAADLRGEKIWFINQDNYYLLNALGLDKKIFSNGGIKTLFSLGQRNFVYVAYVDNGCASARVVDLNSKEVVLQLECLPNPEKVDLNGSGGAWLKLSDSEGLLSTGTPTMAHVNDEINQIAQSNRSLWGKILKLSLVNNKLTVETFSKGHRNPQGLAKIANNIFDVEHGPMGGDEINIIKRGKNYGWPLQSLGTEYDLGIINKSYSKPIKTEASLLSFVPSIGLSYIEKCPQVFSNYYAPNDCLAVSSMSGMAIDLVVHRDGKLLFSEKMQFDSRIRRFFVQGNTIVAVTDFQGIIIGNFTQIYL